MSEITGSQDWLVMFIGNDKAVHSLSSRVPLAGVAGLWKSLDPPALPWVHQDVSYLSRPNQNQVVIKGKKPA